MFGQATGKSESPQSVFTNVDSLLKPPGLTYTPGTNELGKNLKADIIADLKESKQFKSTEPRGGGTVQGEGTRGKFLARVHDIIEEEDTIVLNMNHPLAGEELNFEIELLEVHKPKKPKTAEVTTPAPDENS